MTHGKVSVKKPPKFDIALKDSTDFREYINEIFMREAEKSQGRLECCDT